MRKENEAANKIRVVYIGEDWFLYFGMPGGYDDSEMLAPGCMLGRGTEPYSVYVKNAGPVTAQAVLHPGCLWSAGAGQGLVVLYLDPLSQEARAISRYCGESCKPWQAPPGYSQDLFERMIGPDGKADEIRAFVGAWRKQFLTELPLEPPISNKFVLASKYLEANVEGRLDLEQLCSAVRLNPDYFRKQFKELAGISPSRYQGWQRVLGLLKQVCDRYARGELPPRVTIPTQVVDAGFYDVSHASRTLARYFGVVPQMLPRFVDCR